LPVTLRDRLIMVLLLGFLRVKKIEVRRENLGRGTFCVELRDK
jgi:hypothetical protein